MAVVSKVPKPLADFSPQAALAWGNENKDFISKALEVHEAFIKEFEIVKYQNAYDGNLEEIEKRDKDRGDGINHKLQVDMAQLIIDTVVDYILGKPIAWTVENTDTEKVDQKLVDEYRLKLLKILRSNDAQRVLSEQLRQGSIASYSAVITWVDEKGKIDFEEFPVQEIIPIYDSRGRLRLVIRPYKVEDKTEDGQIIAKTKVEVYDEQYVTYYVKTDEGDGFILDQDEIAENGTGNPVRHKAARIPVSIFVNGTPSRYEDRKKKAGVSDLKAVFSLLENLAGVMSDKANTVDRLLDQFLLFKNVTIDEDEVISMRRARAIALKNKESDAAFIAPSQDDVAVENHLNRLEGKIKETTQTPRLEDLSGASATEIKVKYANLDIKAGKKETYFSQAIRDFIDIITDMLNTQRLIEANVENWYEVLTGETESTIPLYNSEWVQHTFNRNLPQNYLEIAQIVAQLAGTVPDSYLYELLWFIEDPVAALEEMKKQKDADSKRSAAAGLSAMGFGGEFSRTGSGSGTEE